MYTCGSLCVISDEAKQAPAKLKEFMAAKQYLDATNLLVHMGKSSNKWQYKLISCMFMTWRERVWLRDIILSSVYTNKKVDY